LQQKCPHILLTIELADVEVQVNNLREFRLAWRRRDHPVEYL
jgi:hypothetical protein